MQDVKKIAEIDMALPPASRAYGPEGEKGVPSHGHKRVPLPRRIVNNHFTSNA